mgnify:CR=1 FL=1
MRAALTNFRMPKDLDQSFEAWIRKQNDSAGRGPVLLHGDRTRYILDAIRLLIGGD